MGFIQINDMGLDKFWKETPTILKYVFTFTIIIVGCYFFFSRKIYNNQDKELQQLQIETNVTYQLMEKFDDYRAKQYIYNQINNDNINILYFLIDELSQNDKRKFNIFLNINNSNKALIIDKIEDLNLSYTKMLNNYQIKENKTDFIIYKDAQQLSDQRK